MRKVDDKQTDKLLIEITLTLIDEHRGLRGVTLREITRKAGCKHTNLYNYFDSFEDLLWSCLVEVIKQNVDFTNQRMSGYIEHEQLLIKFAESQIEFASIHSGLYHFMWMESLNGEPSTADKEFIHSPNYLFYKFMKEIIATDICDREIQRIADIIHGYLHGEICKFINDRYFKEPKDDYKNYIVENIIKIFSSLTPNNKTSMGVK